MNMLENIRRIGIFMIVAQTMIHFAAGKQYEKYMKIIAGVIVLLQFLSPYMRSTVDVMAKWQKEIETMTEQAERIDKTWQSESYITNYVKIEALSQIEEEVKVRLNKIIPDQECYVSDVSIHLEKEGENDSHKAETGQSGWELRNVKITLWRRTDNEQEIQAENPISNIAIEEITVGQAVEANTEYGGNKEQAHDRDIEEYRNLFAQTLGIAADRVEVSYYGE